MMTQLALDYFQVEAVIVDGIAGGVDPSLDIGDVAVPATWGQYLESLFARETADGFTLPPWAERPYTNFGMMFPQYIEVPTPGGEVQNKFWFDADPELLEVASAVADKVQLEDCTAEGVCLSTPPQVFMGGRGVSGQAFVDNAEFRAYAHATFGARVLDMESAAVAHVAFANDVPFIAFRSLSDLAGGGEGENQMATFFQLAADNAAKVVRAFVRSAP
jgi:adenosylhomocysteine nucleosidase